MRDPRTTLLFVTALLLAVACGKRDAAPTATPAALAAVLPAAPVPATPTPASPAGAAIDPVAPATDPAVPAANPTALATDPAAPAADPAPDAPGRFSLVYTTPKRRKTRALAQGLKEGELFPELVKQLNATFRLPRDLVIRFEDCGESNAFYDEEKRSVQMCWELLQDMSDAFKKDADGADEAASGLINATLFTLFHELGHALVHVLDLPITGREEDAVDQLATWMLVDDGGDEGAEMAIDGAISFLHDAEAEEDGGEEPAYADEHSLSQQRFYNIVCWVYGSRPAGLEDLLESKDGPLPDERAEVCPDEWKKLASAWGTLLKPHLRQ